MRGKYRDPALRAETRARWAQDNVRAIRFGEVKPLRPLMGRTTDLVALDIGANKGFWAKAFLNTFGEGVRHVYMLDPSPENHAELTRREDNLIFAPEDFARVSAHRTAAGAAVGEAVLHTNEDGSPLASFYPHAENGYDGGDLAEVAFTESLAVPVTTVDAFMAEHGIDRVDAMKIDVEGHEYAVLEGADRALTEGRIACLTWEFGMHQVESRCFFRDFWRYLDARDYDLFQVYDGEAHRIPRYAYAFENFTQIFAFAAMKRR